ncbi:glycerophosphodiester phosphodiesterase family protein [Arthrobacter sp. ES3-54]|uniref:glycerophosphodiester phosphodiesterase family protein n=1 Tax=Arthrobacter sp. ES3-54 TaxID=1502991 RepID=UPI0024074850|nr:glycerophosphodiester phosphodiesterase family protein [Arthrobacter sp. ES3-54]MDF9748645.1 hypothetical protein [Arthrobacter sp. ES3-54]
MAVTALFGPGNSTTASAAAASTLSVAKPANVADGDLLVAVAFSQFATGTVTSAPAGWTLIPGTTFTAKSGGVYYKAIPSAAAEAATNYSWTFSGSGRIALDVFRVTGASQSNPVDAVGTMAVQGVGNTTIPSVTAVAANALLVGVAYWNNSNTTVSVVTPGAGMTDGEQVASPTTGSTSGIDVAYQQLNTAGATGTRLFTFNPAAATSAGVMFTLAPQPVANFTGSGTLTVTGKANTSGSVALTGAGSLSVTAGLSYNSTANLTGSGSLTTSATPSANGTATLTGSGSLTALKPGPLDTWLQQPTLYVAHRGGSADWPEETLYAYTQAAAWANAATLALECSVWMSSDGVFVASHDQTTGRIFNGTSYDINVTPWATLSTLTTKVGGYPIARLDNLLPAFPDRAWFVENKGSSGITAFFNLLDANGGPARIVAKQPANNITVNAEARNRGYKTWGYYFDADTPTIAATQSRWDLLGEDYAASAASWAAVKSYGKPVLAHIVDTAPHKTLAASYSPAGYMASGVQEVVPQTPAIAGLAGSGTLTAAGTMYVAPAIDITVTATLEPRRWAGTL